MWKVGEEWRWSLSDVQGSSLSQVHFGHGEINCRRKWPRNISAAKEVNCIDFSASMRLKLY
eukprot:2606635-Rhodomonas_salina.1